MARTVKDVRLHDRAARARLPVSPDIYWRTITEGRHLGYYRGARGGKWVARYREPGGGAGYVKERIGEADDVRDADGETVLSFAEAQRRAHDWFEERARGGAPRAGPFTVGDALDEYLENFRGKSVAATKSRVEAIIRPALGHLEVALLTRKVIADWHNDRAGSARMLRTAKGAKIRKTRAIEGDDGIRRRRSTANRDLTVLRAALNRAADDRQGLPVDAWRGVKPFRQVDSAKLRYLSEDESRRLANACVPAFRPMVQAALLTGARYGELRNLCAGDFDRAARTLWLRETKAGGSRAVYLSDEGAELMKQASAGKLASAPMFTRPDDGKAWAASQQARFLEAACEAGNVARCTFHDLRRTYGARLALQGVPMAVIAEALGHADERMTRKHYAHLSPSYVADTVRAAVTGLGLVEESNVHEMADAREAVPIAAPMGEELESAAVVEPPAGAVGTRSERRRALHPDQTQLFGASG